MKTFDNKANNQFATLLVTVFNVELDSSEVLVRMLVPDAQTLRCTCLALRLKFSLVFDLQCML